MSSNTILWATTIIMLAGGLVILATGKRRTSAETMQTVLHGIVPIIAATLYFAMASGQAVVELPNTDGAAGTRLFYYARYVDWTFTTPLLLLSLGLAGTHTGPKRPALLTGAILADLLMIGTAFAFAASETSFAKWTWFITSCVAFLGVYYVLWGPQLTAAATARDDVRSGYKRDATILSVLWFAYPVILAVAPDGLNIMGDATSVLLIAILDVVSKVAYGLLTVSSDIKVTDRDLAEGSGRAGYSPAAAE